MFDQNDQNQQQNGAIAPEPVASVGTPLVSPPAEPAAAVTPAPDPISMPTPDLSTPAADTNTYNASVFPAAPTEPQVATEPASPPVAVEPASAPEPVATSDPVTPAPTLGEDTTTSAANGDLLSIKKDALQNLSPLLTQLEQTPEEKFRTTMMLIQASDDQSLIQQAYDSANAITDEKVKAQALLDVVNEINYFTQQSKTEDKPAA